MQVIVKGHHIHVSDALRASALHKLEKLGRFFDRIQKMEVEFSHEKTARAAVSNRVDVVVTTPVGIVAAHARATQPEIAVDAVVEKLERQIKRLKEKMVHHGAPKGGARAKAASPRLGRAAPVSLDAFSANGAEAQTAEAQTAAGDEEAAAVSDE